MTTGARRGLRVFGLIAAGEFVSLIGSLLSGFALGVWVYQQTGSTTQFALITLCTTLPSVLISPLAGVVLDRRDRRRVLIMAELGIALSILLLLVLVLTGQLQVWQIYLTTAISSICTAFLRPGYASVTPLLVDEQDLGRANGMLQMAQALPQLLAPALAGLLLLVGRIEHILFVDLLSFLFPIGTLLAIKIPPPPTTAEGQAGGDSLLGRAGAGWRYVAARPGLLGVMVLFAVTNFVGNMAGVLVTPLVLSFASETTLGMLLSIGGVGMLVGSVAMATWGGPQRRIRGMVCFMLLGGLFIALVGLRPSVPLLALAGFGFFFTVPLTGGCMQVIWQRKIAPDLQGRVFALTGMVVMSTTPLAALLAGPLADGVFEPLLRVDGGLAGSVGQVIGVGPGRGMGLMFVIAGVLTMAIALLGYLYPRLRLLEAELPDVGVARSAPEPEELGEVRLSPAAAS